MDGADRVDGVDGADGEDHAAEIIGPGFRHLILIQEDVSWKNFFSWQKAVRTLGLGLWSGTGGSYGLTKLWICCFMETIVGYFLSKNVCCMFLNVIHTYP